MPCLLALHPPGAHPAGVWKAKSSTNLNADAADAAFKKVRRRKSLGSPARLPAGHPLPPGAWSRARACCLSVAKLEGCSPSLARVPSRRRNGHAPSPGHASSRPASGPTRRGPGAATQPNPPRPPTHRQGVEAVGGDPAKYPYEQVNSQAFTGLDPGTDLFIVIAGVDPSSGMFWGYRYSHVVGGEPRFSRHAGVAHKQADGSLAMAVRAPAAGGALLQSGRRPAALGGRRRGAGPWVWPRASDHAAECPAA